MTHHKSRVAGSGLNQLNDDRGVNWECNLTVMEAPHHGSNSPGTEGSPVSPVRGFSLLVRGDEGDPGGSLELY